MTLEEESRLSFYRELTVLDEKKNIVLVQDIRNSELCVKKTLDIYSHDVYEQLASVRIEGVPAIKECVADDGKCSSYVLALNIRYPLILFINHKKR